MFRIALISLFAAAMLAGPTPVFAHEADLRSQDLTPRVGNMSDDVIVQRLRLAGVENAQIVSRNGAQVSVRGTQAGQQKQFEIETLSGRVFELSAGQRRPFIGGAAAAARPIITGPQITEERESFANPQLMRDVVVQERQPERIEPPRMAPEHVQPH
jgi:hypothetical protein